MVSASCLWSRSNHHPVNIPEMPDDESCKRNSPSQESWSPTAHAHELHSPRFLPFIIPNGIRSRSDQQSHAQRNACTPKSLWVTSILRRRATPLGLTGVPSWHEERQKHGTDNQRTRKGHLCSHMKRNHASWTCALGWSSARLPPKSI